MGPNLITTVTTAAASYDLTTLDVVKDELNIKTGVSDLTLKRYITSCSAAAMQFCNRVFQVETIQDLFWAQRDKWPQIIPGGMDALQLTRWPIVSVTTVTEHGCVLVQDTDFKIDADNGQLLRLDINGYPRKWPVYPIVIIYQGGYAAIPSDVQDAVVRMVRDRWLSRGRDPRLMEENIPGVREARWWIPSGTDAGNMAPEVIDLLNNYRVPVVR